MLNNLCRRLNIVQSDFRGAESVKVKVIKTENVAEQYLCISEAPELCAEIDDT